MSWPFTHTTSRADFSSTSIDATPENLGCRGSTVISTVWRSGVTSSGKVHFGVPDAAANRIGKTKESIRRDHRNALHSHYGILQGNHHRDLRRDGQRQHAPLWRGAC